MQHILIIGATRGLGSSLLTHYASLPNTIVYGTTRSSTPPLIKLDAESGKYGGEDTGKGKVVWVTGIDLMEEGAAKSLVNQLGGLGMGGGMVEGGVRGFNVVVCAIYASVLLSFSFASIHILFANEGYNLRMEIYLMARERLTQPDNNSGLFRNRILHHRPLLVRRSKNVHHFLHRRPFPRPLAP
jgi:NAD(P)-dependent dehydrogenase (short-subunit alcohol dehydrogenase family)